MPSRIGDFHPPALTPNQHDELMQAIQDALAPTIERLNAACDRLESVAAVAPDEPPAQDDAPVDKPKAEPPAQ